MKKSDSLPVVSNTEINTLWLKLANLKWDRLVSNYTPILYNKKSILYRSQEYNDYVFVVQSGRVGLYLISPSGYKKIIGIAEEGSVIGELSLFHDSPNSCTAETYTDSLIYKIPSAVFREKIFADKILCENTYKNLTAKIKMLQSQIEYLTYKNATAKVSMFLLSMCKAHGEKHNKEYKIKISFSHNDVAESTGLTRVSVTNTLLDLTNQNILTKRDGVYWITDIVKLNEIIDNS